MASHPSPKRAVETPTIPDRLYFKIGDVRGFSRVETYVLRFWESQFPQLKPNKSGTGQRLYRRRDVEMAVEIKRLVHAEATRSGARQALGQANAVSRRPRRCSGAGTWRQGGEKGDKVADVIGRARIELREIAGMLASPPKASTPPQVQPLRRRMRPSNAEKVSGSLFDA